MTDMSRDSIVDRHCLPQRYVPYAVNSRPTSHKIWSFLHGVYSHGNDFELIPAVKMETRHPVEDYLVMNFRRSIIITELWRPKVARRLKRFFSVFVEKTTPYGEFFKILFWKDSSRHRSTCGVQIS